MKNKFQIVRYGDFTRRNYTIIEEFDTKEEAIEILADMALDLPYEQFNEICHGSVTYEEYIKTFPNRSTQFTEKIYRKMIITDAWERALRMRARFRGNHAVYDIIQDVYETGPGVYSLTNIDEYGEGEEIVAYFYSRADAEEFLMSLWEEDEYEEFCMRVNLYAWDENIALNCTQDILESYKDKNQWKIEKIEIL